jgi:hypothetical protein
VAHFVTTEAQPACDVFHNAWFHCPDNLSAQFVLARLAWTVLPMTDAFNTLHGSTVDKRPSSEVVVGGLDQSQLSPKRNNNPDPNNQRRVGALRRGGETRPQNGPRDAAEGAVPDEERELVEDLKKAMRHYPDVFDPYMSSGSSDDSSAPACLMHSYAHLDPRRARMARYYADTLSWYPGVGRTERIAKAYMETHPQVRQTSGGPIYDGSCSDDSFEF